jgi:integrase/recombinase XerC
LSEQFKTNSKYQLLIPPAVSGEEAKIAVSCATIESNIVLVQAVKSLQAPITITQPSETLEDAESYWHVPAEEDMDYFSLAHLEKMLINDAELRIEKQQASSTINRNLASIRKYFKWLSGKGHVKINPTIGVKELKRQPLAPQGLTRAEVRKILREVELRGDIRAKAIFSLILYTGARLSDVTYLELSDLSISDRAGTVFYRHGKGSKQRVVPLPLNARKAIAQYFETRPPVDSQRVFIGERGELNRRAIQAIFEKYKALTGIENLHCHVLRHTFSHTMLSQGGNLAQLAQILGHESLNTVSIYTLNSIDQLADITEQLNY